MSKNGELLFFIQSPHDTSELTSGTGGGDNGGMDVRIAKLESAVEHIQSDITDVKATLVRLSDAVAQLSVTVARIDAKLDSKVDHKWLTVSVLGIVAVILRFEIAALFQ